METERVGSLALVAWQNKSGVTSIRSPFKFKHSPPKRLLLIVRHDNACTAKLQGYYKRPLNTAGGVYLTLTSRGRERRLARSK